MKNIKYLDLGESIYIENNEIKERVNENQIPHFVSWDEGWRYVLSALDKIKNYDEQQNTNRNNCIK